MPSPSSAGEAGDLESLLRTRGFAHWHALLQELMDRYRGWLADYEFEPLFDPDYRPLTEVIHALLQLPQPAWGSDQALCAALAKCDFLVRAAVHRASGTRWDPLQQSYRDFKARFADAEPFWELQMPWSSEDFSAWALDRLGRG